MKIAEHIRKDVPFAILIPLPLLNEIDRTSKTEIDPEIRRKDEIDRVQLTGASVTY